MNISQEFKKYAMSDYNVSSLTMYNYEKQIENQGGFKNGEIIDTSGEFNKQLIIPPVTDWDSNPLSYTDNMAEISSCKVYEHPASAYSSEYFLHSNTSYISPKMPTNDGLA